MDDDRTQRAGRELAEASAEVRARVRASFERQGLMSHLGARMTLIAPGRVHIVLPGRPEVTQQHGYFHAGATSAIADTAGATRLSRCSGRTATYSPSSTRSTSSRPPPATTWRRWARS